MSKPYSSQTSVSIDLMQSMLCLAQPGQTSVQRCRCRAQHWPCAQILEIAMLTMTQPHDAWALDTANAQQARCCLMSLGRQLAWRSMLRRTHTDQQTGCAERALDRRLLANRFGDSSMTLTMSMSQSGSFDTSTHSPEAGTLALARMQQEVQPC